MTSTTKYIDRLSDWISDAVWKHLNTRRDYPSKSLQPLPPEAAAWLKAGTGGGPAPTWLRDAMKEGTKTQLKWDWGEPTDPLGSVTGETPKIPAEPKPNTGTTAESQRDAFAAWVEHAMLTRLNRDILNDKGKLRELPGDAQKWLETGTGALGPVTVIDWVAEAVDDLNWDDEKTVTP